MNSNKNNLNLNIDDDFPYPNSPSKQRIIKVLYNYLEMRTHEDRDRLHDLLKSKLERIEEEPKEASN